MKKFKNRFIGKCDICNKDLYAFGTPFVVQEHDVIYKKFFCHTANPKTDCLQKHWNKEKETSVVV